MKKVINVDGVEVTYDLDKLVAEANNIPYNEERYINHHRTSGDGITPHEGAPTEEEFFTLRTNFANDIENIEESLEGKIRENLFLTKKGALAKNRRRPILTGHHDFYVNVIDEYDHDLQFDRPFLKMERTDDKEAKLIIYEMQTN